MVVLAALTAVVAEDADGTGALTRGAIVARSTGDAGGNFTEII